MKKNNIKFLHRFQDPEAKGILEGYAKESNISLNQLYNKIIHEFILKDLDFKFLIFIILMSITFGVGAAFFLVTQNFIEFHSTIGLFSIFAYCILTLIVNIMTLKITKSDDLKIGHATLGFSFCITYILLYLL